MSAHIGLNVIPFPRKREKSLCMLREAVWTLERTELSRIGVIMSRLVDDALHDAEEEEFYERVKTAYALYERILIEGDRLC